jgi:BON domain
MRTSLFLALMLFGCAHAGPPLTEAERSSVYRAVRNGAALESRADNLLFCASREGLEVTHAENTGPDDWADRMSNARVRDDVAAKLGGDSALRGDAIHARTVDGEVILSGRVSSDEHALRAVEDALSIAGVVLVNADLRSPESPNPPRVTSLAWCASPDAP